MLTRSGMFSVLVVLAPLALAGLVHAQPTPVAVVAAGDGDAYRAAARVAAALRRKLAAKGRAALDPAVVIGVARAAPRDLLAQAQERTASGQGAYDGLEFDRAARAFKEARGHYRQALRLGAPLKGYVQLLHLLAAASFFDSKKKEARAQFADAIALRPELRPDKQVFPPDVVKAWREVKESAQRGVLRVSSTPPAEVTVDGRPAGVTPLELSTLPAGEHLVQLRRAGYEGAARFFRVKAGASVDARPPLQPLASLPRYTQLVAGAVAELVAARPGPSTAALQELLRAGALVLVVGGAGPARAAWAEGGAWSHRYSAVVAAGEEEAFAEGLLAATAVLPPAPDNQGGPLSLEGCPAGCPGGQQCVSGRCLPHETSRPIYQRWWFWTVIGTVVAGATVGAVLGVRARRDTWTAEVQPRGGL